jgi:hypothetical protein
MTADPRPVLDAQIRGLEEQLNRLREIRVLCDDAVFRRHLAVAFGAPVVSEPSAQNGAEGAPSTTFLGRLQRFFHGNGNEWATTTEVAQATGISAKAARDAMGRTHRSRFEDRVIDKSGRKQWRLRV